VPTSAAQDPLGGHRQCCFGAMQHALQGQGRGHQADHAERDLDCGQHAAGARAQHSATAAHAIDGLNPRRAPGRPQSGEHGCQQGHRQGECHGHAIQANVGHPVGRREFGRTQELHCPLRTSHRQRKCQHRCRQANQPCLYQAGKHQASPTGAYRGTDRRFATALKIARQQQLRDIGTRDHQHQEHQREHRGQHGSHGTGEVLHVLVHPHRIGRRGSAGILVQPLQQCIERRVGARHAGPWRQATPHVHGDLCVAGRNLGRHPLRQPDAVVERKGEALRHHAHHGRGLAINPDLASQHILATVESLLPERVTDDHCQRRADRFVAADQLTTTQGHDAQVAKTAGAHKGRLQALGNHSARQVDIALAEGMQRLETCLRFLHGAEVLQWHLDPAVPGLRIDIAHMQQLLAFGERRRAQQVTLDHRKHEETEAEAGAEHADRGQAEPGRAQQATHRNANFLQQHSGHEWI
jgi:hypothetical protein